MKTQLIREMPARRVRHHFMPARRAYMPARHVRHHFMPSRRVRHHPWGLHACTPFRSVSSIANFRVYVYIHISRSIYTKCICAISAHLSERRACGNTLEASNPTTLHLASTPIQSKPPSLQALQTNQSSRALGILSNFFCWGGLRSFPLGTSNPPISPLRYWNKIQQTEPSKNSCCARLALYSEVLPTVLLCRGYDNSFARGGL